MAARKMANPGSSFQSILVANRGEIACRIIRSARALGLRTIAVYSDADRDAPHVKMADAAICIGPAAVHESYLNQDRIMAAIAETRAEAVHPGYGFLSENASFAAACQKAGVCFIGPPVDAIDLMGDKAKAKRRMIKAGVPCIPGYQGEEQSDRALVKASAEIGFPIMVKAAAGGGGRGMRLVTDAGAFPDAVKAARSEAINAFGSAELILEKAIMRPRHVEIQVFADQHGHVIHLGERDCSVQRRHQKVVEEAPCPVMTPALRKAMGAAAVKAAKDIDYVGAGTVEFLLDEDGAFYFLEMNTRLQVEHPVTEMITGQDLVAMQIRAAQGEKLKLKQQDVALSGHAIEARLYAEDAAQDFLPATGPIHVWQPPVGPSIRTDAGIEGGGEVTPFYDPMIAKIIAHGTSREEARQKLVRALKETQLFGVTSNKRFLIDVLERDEFIAGKATTAFIEDNFAPADLQSPPLAPQSAAAAALLLFHAVRAQSLSSAVTMVSELLNWSSATPITVPYAIAQGEDVVEVEITALSAGRYCISAGDQTFVGEILEISTGTATMDMDGERIRILFHYPPGGARGAHVQMSIDGRDYDLENRNAIIAPVAQTVGAGSITAPMHGQLLEILVAEGDHVQKGQRLAILEAMKMQHEIQAENDGTVRAVHFDRGVQVPANAPLIDIDIAKGEG